MSILLILSQLLVFIAKAMDTIYLFQIKEYRFDRIWSTLREKGIIQTIYNTTITFPAHSIRNYLIVGGTLLMAPILFLILQPLALEDVILTIPMIPLIGFLNTTLWVALTEIPAQIKRRRTITQAQAKIQKHPVPVIAISGTYGKTSVKEYLFHILSTTYHVAKTDKNMNTDVGVAQCVLQNITDETQYFLAEMGAYKKGEIADICKAISPTYGILTAAGNQHVDLFGSRENLVHAEAEILTYLPEQGRGYVNTTIPGITILLQNLQAPITTFSPQQGSSTDCTIEEISTSQQGTKARITIRGREMSIRTTLLGEHTIHNLLPCIACALDLGVSEDNIQKAIQSLKPIRHKLSLHPGIQGSTILSDSSNSNVEGFIQAIRVADRMPQEKKILISKGIIELGKEKRESYKRILKELENTKIKLYTTDYLFSKIWTTYTAHYFEHEDLILAEIQKITDNNTLLIIEGRFTPSFVKKLIKE